LAGTDTRSINAAKVPASLKQPCRPVADLPEGDLSSATAARLWGQDRASLGECSRRHAALVRTVDAIEGQGK